MIIAHKESQANNSYCTFALGKTLGKCNSLPQNVAHLYFEDIFDNKPYFYYNISD